jgi:hypothetical protein
LGKDYVFVTPKVQPGEPTKQFKTADGRLTFQGTAGSVQVRGNGETITLGAAGEIRIGDKKLASETATTRTIPN